MKILSISKAVIQLNSVTVVVSALYTCAAVIYKPAHAAVLLKWHQLFYIGVTGTPTLLYIGIWLFEALKGFQYSDYR